jgi:hypothetical protein
MNYATGTKKGRYIVNNPHKYIGTKHPIFKSNWEQNVFSFLDNNQHVVKWGYECYTVSYHNPVLGKTSIYYPDIFVHIKYPTGEQKYFLVEIKPYKYTIPPSPPKIKNVKAVTRFRAEQKMYAVNVAKWEAAQAWCRKHHVQWLLLTEKNCGFMYQQGKV